MWIHIYCSRCSSNRRFSSNDAKTAAVRMVKGGWGSCGTSIYCPTCTRTWAERNTLPMSDHLNTVAEIMDTTIKHITAERDQL